MYTNDQSIPGTLAVKIIAAIIAVMLLAPLVCARAKVLPFLREALASAAVILLVVALIIATPHAIVGVWSLIAAQGGG
jgi:hypothetical protein